MQFHTIYMWFQVNLTTTDVERRPRSVDAYSKRPQPSSTVDTEGKGSAQDDNDDADSLSDGEMEDGELNNHFLQHSRWAFDTLGEINTSTTYLLLPGN